MIDEAADSLYPSPRMVRAARALVDLDQAELASAIGVDRKTIVRTETSTREKVDARRREVLLKIRNFLETNYAIEFLFPDEHTGEGVRLRKPAGGK